MAFRISDMIDLQVDQEKLEEAEATDDPENGDYIAGQDDGEEPMK